MPVSNKGPPNTQTAESDKQAVSVDNTGDRTEPKNEASSSQLGNSTHHANGRPKQVVGTKEAKKAAKSGKSKKPMEHEKNVGRPKNCPPQDTEWSACSETCDVGVSFRMTNGNPQCTAAMEYRLCFIRPCDVSFGNQVTTRYESCSIMYTYFVQRSLTNNETLD